MLAVTVHTEDGEEISYEGDDCVDFVSLVSPDTYGPPALIAPAKQGQTRARQGQRVLYINTRLVPLFEITRVGD